MGLFKKKKQEEIKIKNPEELKQAKIDVEKEVNNMRDEYDSYVKEHNKLIEQAHAEGKPVEDVINKHQQEQREDANKPIPENLYEKYDWKIKLLEKSVLLICLGFIAAMVIFAVKMTLNSDNETIKKLVVYMVLMGMLMFILILINLGTGTGIEIWKRFVYKFKYKKGTYVNGIVAMKSGVWKEFFIKKEETGEIRINKKPYVPNPKLLFVYKGIPSYFYREGCPDPLNYWETKLTIGFSCAEVDKVMYSAATFDFKQWLQKNLMIFLIGVVATVLFAIIAAIFAFMVYTMLKKGQYNVEPMANVCKEIFNLAVNQTQAVVTSTGNIPVPVPVG